MAQGQAHRTSQQQQRRRPRRTTSQQPRRRPPSPVDRRTPSGRLLPY